MKDKSGENTQRKESQRQQQQNPFIFVGVTLIKKKILEIRREQKSRQTNFQKEERENFSMFNFVI